MLGCTPGMKPLYCCLSACLPACICLPACLPICLPARLPICLPACLPISLPARLPICLPIPASLPACLCACPTLTLSNFIKLHIMWRKYLLLIFYKHVLFQYSCLVMFCSIFISCSVSSLFDRTTVPTVFSRKTPATPPKREVYINFCIKYTHATLAKTKHYETCEPSWEVNITAQLQSRTFFHLRYSSSCI